jgi:uncharacterized protein YxjI
MKFTLREKIISIRDVFDIKDENGNVAYTMTSRILALRRMFVLEKPDGSNVSVVKWQWLSFWPQYKIRVIGGGRAKIRKAFFRVSGFGPKFIIKSSKGRMVAAGNFLAHDYDFKLGGEKIAEVSKHWISITDTYGLEIFDEADVPMIISCVVVIDDFMAREEKKKPQPTH